jgi:hypothetical protein
VDRKRAEWLLFEIWVGKRAKMKRKGQISMVVPGNWKRLFRGRGEGELLKSSILAFLRIPGCWFESCGRENEQRIEATVSLFGQREMSVGRGIPRTAKAIRGFTPSSGSGERPGSVNGALILRCGALDRSIAKNLLGEKTRLFQDHPSGLEETEYAVKATTDSQAFA